jgi:hypothetical protein
MGHSNAQRQICCVAESTLIIIGTFQTSAGAVEKHKLVELYPDRHAWNATHLTGPNKYSQFQYQIENTDTPRSCLIFTGLFLGYEKENLSVDEVAALADQLCREDAETWQCLAQAMAKDLL